MLRCGRSAAGRFSRRQMGEMTNGLSDSSKAEIYGTPKERLEARYSARTKVPKASPVKPAVLPRKIKTNCITDSALEIETEGAANEPRAVIETIMIRSGLAIPAETAD